MQSSAKTLYKFDMSLCIDRGESEKQEFLELRLSFVLQKEIKGLKIKNHLFESKLKMGVVTAENNPKAKDMRA